MNKKTQALLGVALIVASTVLLVFFADTEIGWFTGRPLGIVLGIVGLLDLLEALRKSRSADR